MGVRFRRIIGGICAALCATLANAANVTLSDVGILALDHYWYSNSAVEIARRDVPGPGVEFDIQFLSSEFPGYAFYPTSSIYGGAGDWVGLDVSMYDAFSLDFRLVDVDGSGTARELVVGALIGPTSDGYIWGYTPQHLSPGGPFGATSVTPFTPSSIEAIGFASWLLPDSGWDPAGATVTLRVSPTPGAVQIPEPAALVIVVALALGLRNRQVL